MKVIRSERSQRIFCSSAGLCRSFLPLEVFGSTGGLLFLNKSLVAQEVCYSSTGLKKSLVSQKVSEFFGRSLIP